MDIMLTVLLAVALACFLLDAIGVPSRIGLTAAGLFCWVLVVFIQWLTATY